MIFELGREERMRSKQANISTSTNQHQHQAPSRAALKTTAAPPPPPPPPMGAFLVKEEYEQVILRQFDKTTSTIPTKYWNMPPEENENESLSSSSSLLDLERVANLRNNETTVTTA
jgi:hypothetical protein